MLWPTLLAVAATVYLVVRVVMTLRARDAPRVRPIRPTSTPPPELTPGVAARLLRDVNDAEGVVAEVLDLAVKGAWQLGVREVDGAGTWALLRPSPYGPILDQVPEAVYRGVFNRADMTVARTLVPSDTRAAHAKEARTRAEDLVVAKGWVRRHRGHYLVLNLVGQALLAGSLAIPIAAAMNKAGSLVDPGGPEGLPLIIYGGSAGFFSQFLGVKPWTLTPEGRRLVDEVEGLRAYMTLPDDERSRVLDTDAVSRVKAHERLLPYAALFGIMPDWVEVLRADHARAGTSPAWVEGGGQDAAATASVYASLAGVGGLRRLGA